MVRSEERARLGRHDGGEPLRVLRTDDFIRRTVFDFSTRGRNTSMLTLRSRQHKHTLSLTPSLIHPSDATDALAKFSPTVMFSVQHYTKKN